MVDLNGMKFQRLSADVETILSACRADKKCPFSNLNFMDNVLEFEFNKKTTKIFYWINITEEYPDNSLLTTSKNIPGAEPVTEVVSGRLPVIFNKIAKEMYQDMKLVPIEIDMFHKSTRQAEPGRIAKKFKTWTTIRKGESDSDFTQSDSEEEANDIFCEEDDETALCTQLETEIESVRAKYGQKAIIIRSFGSIDQCDIELLLDTTCIEDDVAKAWNLIVHKPLHILLHLSMSHFSFVPGHTDKVEVFQEQDGVNVKKGACYQIEKILDRFISDNCLFSTGVPSHDQLQPCSSGSSANITKKALTAALKAIMKSKKSPSHSTVEDCKNVPTSANGVFIQMLMYAEQRLTWLSEFCVICDNRHLFHSSMLKPTVCSRDLCVFSFQTLGVMSNAADDVSTDPEVVDLLIAMARSACCSVRKEKIMEPFPSVVDPHNPQSLALDPQNKDFVKLQKAVDNILPTEELIVQALSKTDLKKKMDEKNPLSYRLLEWIISSNRSHIVKLPHIVQLSFMKTRHQFLMRSSAPAKEAAFIEARAKHGSTFAFHGSHIENWHSIVRRGLLNASGTALQVNGAAYGSGIYLSPLTKTSFNYSGITKCTLEVKGPTKTTAAKSKFLVGQRITCIALCEVITSSNLKKHADGIWVMPVEDFVCTRFFFVYDDGSCGDLTTDTQNAEVLRKIKEIMSRAGP